jgi:glycosyltransferase involved in cell wall biosynthesis
VLTPVYNGERYLAQCIESVLSQTYKNYEYIIVNNCSTDKSLEIALWYAKKDRHIRVLSNNKFVGVIDNHNIAFRLISESAKYCKVVSADDFIFPDCLMRMVELGEANPSVGIIGSYQLSGDQVRWQGFKYPRAVFAGVEICRKIFLGCEKTFGFGSPTSILYRADLVRNTDAFYPNSSPHADTSACFANLRKCDFGFVYQVLSYERIHEATQSSKSAEMNRYSSANLNDLVQYGPLYLSRSEFERELKKQLKSYYQFLAVNYFIGSRDKEFWDYHRCRLQELGYPLRHFALLRAALSKVFEECLNPEQAVRRIWRRIFPNSTVIRVRGV